VLSAGRGRNLRQRVSLPLLGFLLFAPGSVAATRLRPSIVLVTLDTVRADRMGFLGSRRRLTPNLDALAERSVVFTHAYAQAPLTNPSHATILSGTYPQLNLVNDFGVPMAPGLPYLPEILHASGYVTGAFVSSHVLSPSDAPGFGRGFEVYDAGMDDRRSAAVVVARATAWLGQQAAAAPFFLWVHLYDAHAPYEPPEPFRSRHATEPYDGAIEYADSEVGHLLAELGTMGRLNDAVLAVMSDHGEAFGEHGERQHGYLLYDETIRVPLLIRLPEERPSGRRVDTMVGLVDLAPTLLEIVGLPVPAAMQGASLLPPAGQPQTGADRPRPRDHGIYSETDYPNLAFGWSPLKALRKGTYLFIEAPRPELYDTSRDPVAEEDLSLGLPAVTATLAATLDAFRRATCNTRTAPRPALAPEVTRQLNALGYVASAPEEMRPPTDQGPLANPRDRIEVANRMTEALLAMNDGHYREALPLIRYALEHEPDSIVVNRVMGEDLIWTQDYEGALTPLRKALRLGSDLAMTHYQLGLALFGLKDWPGAVSEFKAAVARAGNWAEAHYSMGAAYERLEQFHEAETELAEAVGLQPSHFLATLELGQVQLLLHNPKAAAENLARAAALQPESSEAHRFLALAYSRLGRDEEAQREKAEAERLRVGSHP
jgi:arylsulfatase A-like enzyme/Flp pilus assembly protein TadD